MTQLTIRLSRFFLVFILLAGVLTLGACGGGGGGGGGSSQAVVDENNAYDLITGAFSGAWLAAELDTVIILMFDEIFIDEEGGYAGACGGNLTYSGTYNEVSGAFSGSVTMNELCEEDFFGEDVVVDGSISASGFIDIDTDELKTYTIKINNFTASTAQESETLTGNIAVDLTSFPAVLSFSGSLKDNITGKTYRMTNMVMEVYEGIDFIDIVITGKYEDSDYGSVVVSTEEAFRFFDFDDWFSSGILVATGDTGIEGGATKSKMSVLNDTAFLVEADTDGDGLYDDYSSGAVSWDEI